MKKILFLTRSYPETFGSATLLCMHRVMNCVADSGRYEVHILCMRYPDEAYEEEVNRVIVHRFNPTWWQALRNRFHKTRKYNKLARVMEVVSKTLTIPTFPRTEPLTDRKFTQTARKLQRKYGFDLVVSEHHGLSTLLTGCRLMKEFEGLKHIAVLWDPVKGQMVTMKLPKNFTDHRIENIEEFAARYTTLQISTLSMKAYHSEHGDIVADHRIYLDIPSILKPEAEVPTDKISLIREGGINIVFSGLLSEYYRDAQPIIRLLGKTIFASQINMLFFSRGEKEAVEDAAKDFSGEIIYHDYIPLAELHTMYRHADYLLNVSHINANMVPSKIFEYMSYGKPIISTYVTDGDSAEKYVSRYSEGLCIDLKKSDDENVSSLEDFLKKEHKIVPFEEVKAEYKDNTPERYLEVIKEMI
ncbi:MAG: glycosyltransferase [Bacteroidaceae bacterium]|nr:glycosyltransferase [Bacteroidaceae bacterium]